MNKVQVNNRKKKGTWIVELLLKLFLKPKTWTQVVLQVKPVCWWQLNISCLSFITSGFVVSVHKRRQDPHSFCLKQVLTNFSGKWPYVSINSMLKYSTRNRKLQVWSMKHTNNILLNRAKIHHLICNLPFLYGCKCNEIHIRHKF